MSLTDLEIRTHTKPLRAELDRQKENAAKFKQERDAVIDAAAAFSEHFVNIHNPRAREVAADPTATALWERLDAALVAARTP